MALKKGDKVKVLPLVDYVGGPGFGPVMQGYVGKIVTVKSVDDWVKLKEDHGCWVWHKDWFRKVTNKIKWL